MTVTAKKDTLPFATQQAWNIACPQRSQDPLPCLTCKVMMVDQTSAIRQQLMHHARWKRSRRDARIGPSLAGAPGRRQTLSKISAWAVGPSRPSRNVHILIISQTHSIFVGLRAREPYSWRRLTCTRGVRRACTLPVCPQRAVSDWASTQPALSHSPSPLFHSHGSGISTWSRTFSLSGKSPKIILVARTPRYGCIHFLPMP